MVSITLSVSEEIKAKMDKFNEMNWSGFVRKAIEEKTRELFWREEMLKKLDGEKEFIKWAVKLQKKGRKGRFAELKREGLI